MRLGLLPSKHRRSRRRVSCFALAIAAVGAWLAMSACARTPRAYQTAHRSDSLQTINEILADDFPPAIYGESLRRTIERVRAEQGWATLFAKAGISWKTRDLPKGVRSRQGHQEALLKVYRAFLKKNSSGLYATRARARIAELELAIAMRDDTVEGYGRFLEAHPRGRLRPVAETCRRTLERRQRELDQLAREAGIWGLAGYLSIPSHGLDRGAQAFVPQYRPHRPCASEARSRRLARLVHRRLFEQLKGKRVRVTAKLAPSRVASIVRLGSETVHVTIGDATISLYPAAGLAVGFRFALPGGSFGILESVGATFMTHVELAGRLDAVVSSALRRDLQAQGFTIVESGEDVELRLGYGELGLVTERSKEMDREPVVLIENKIGMRLVLGMVDTAPGSKPIYVAATDDTLNLCELLPDEDCKVFTGTAKNGNALNQLRERIRHLVSPQPG